MHKFWAAILANVVPLIFALSVNKIPRISSVVTIWYHLRGELRDSVSSIVWQIAIANFIFFFIFVDAHPIQGFKESSQWLAALVGLWPFWMFVGSLFASDIKLAWLNYRQTWIKVFFGYCFNLSAAIIFLLIVQQPS